MNTSSKDSGPLRHQVICVFDPATPTLVIAGESDVSTPWAGNVEVLAREIPDAKSVRLPAAHLSNLEQPRPFTAALLIFLVGGSTEKGVEVRRRVLGNVHVDKSIAATTEFTRDFQDLITRYAWGDVWSGRCWTTAPDDCWSWPSWLGRGAGRNSGCTSGQD